MPLCQRLPTGGEMVIINGLVSSPKLNGKRGRIIRYDKDIHRYRIQLQVVDGDGSAKAVKPQNISLLPNKKTDAS